jgi:hypothetical protein
MRALLRPFALATQRVALDVRHGAALSRSVHVLPRANRAQARVPCAALAAWNARALFHYGTALRRTKTPRRGPRTAATQPASPSAAAPSHSPNRRPTSGRATCVRPRRPLLAGVESLTPSWSGPGLTRCATRSLLAVDCGRAVSSVGIGAAVSRALWMRIVLGGGGSAQSASRALSPATRARAVSSSTVPTRCSRFVPLRAASAGTSSSGAAHDPALPRRATR